LVAFKEPLTKEEESFWLKELKEGNEKARNVLVEHNLRLVAHIAKKYLGCEKEMEDMLSIGTIGLIKAVNTYKESKGNKLVTYASRCIENEILMFLRSEKKKNREVSIYEPIGTDKEGNVINLLDIIMCEDEDIIEIGDTNNKILEIFNGYKDTLNSREREIIRRRYGILGEKPVTQRELATEMNISRSYVSRIEKKALEKLKKYIENHIDFK
jgi:RNA polymerase sporulation-specific sigma factor